MDFSNATVLGITRKSEFIGDTARYKTTKELKIEGYLLNLGNTDGVAGVLSELEAFDASANNWQDIILNGVDMGQGTIVNLNFAQDRDVTKKTYTATIRIPEQGDFSSLIGTDYTGLGYTNFQFLEHFSESSSFQGGIKKDTYSQNIKITLKGPYSLNAVTAAQTIAHNFLENNDLINTVGTQYNNQSVKKYYDESYDEINNVFDFSYKYDINNDSNGVYSLTRSHTLDFDTAGIAKVIEKAEYQGHTPTQFDTANTQARIDIGNAYTRCAAIFAGYLNSSQNRSLSTNALSKSWVGNPFDGKITYSITFSNAAKISAYTSYWEYEISVDKSEAGNYSLTESGNVVGFGHVIETKYSNALADWKGHIQNSISTRLAPYYTAGGNLRLLSDSTTYQKVTGKITYNVKYTDSDSLLTSQDVRKATIIVSKQFNRNLNSSYKILNAKEIVQVQPNLLPNMTSYNISLNGKSTLDINTYLAAAKAYVAGYDSNSFLSEASYSFNPFSRNFTLNVGITTLPASLSQ